MKFGEQSIIIHEALESSAIKISEELLLGLAVIYALTT